MGAAIAVPVPGIGPLAGAAIGAGVGVYKNIMKKESSHPIDQSGVPKDVHADLLKFDELRQKGIISDAEFEIQKKRVLGDNQ